MDNRFDDLRPYTDEELPAAMERIAADGNFPAIASFIFPDRPLEEVRSLVCGIRGTYDLQTQVMMPLTERIIDTTTDGFTYSGTDMLRHGEPYLFIGNHRDIMLDSTLLQYVLLANGHDSSEITFGSNLMSSTLLVDIGKSNKMFKVVRGGNIKDFYRNSMHLSEYLRHTLTEKRSSVWIAQRNGRTKDGNDVTDKGIINMFCMSCKENKVKALAELHIVPLAVSYEWEPCDILKTLELYASRFGAYVKKKGEDLNSILTGISQPKGRVHMEFCPLVTEDELSRVSDTSRNEYYNIVARIIDRRLWKAFRLYPNNFIAHDLLHHECRFSDNYTKAQKEAFQQRMMLLEQFKDYDMSVLMEIFLRIYATPVDNKEQVSGI